MNTGVTKFQLRMALTPRHSRFQLPGFKDSGFKDSGFKDSGFKDSGFEDSRFNDSGLVIRDQ